MKTYTISAELLGALIKGSEYPGSDHDIARAGRALMAAPDMPSTESIACELLRALEMENQFDADWSSGNDDLEGIKARARAFVESLGPQA